MGHANFQLFVHKLVELSVTIQPGSAHREMGAFFLPQSEATIGKIV
jgi:hypothetical protein